MGLEKKYKELLQQVVDKGLPYGTELHFAIMRKLTEFAQKNNYKGVPGTGLNATADLLKAMSYWEIPYTQETHDFVFNYGKKYNEGQK